MMIDQEIWAQWGLATSGSDAHDTAEADGAEPQPEPVQCPRARWDWVALGAMGLVSLLILVWGSK